MSGAPGIRASSLTATQQRRLKRFIAREIYNHLPRHQLGLDKP